MPSSPWIRGGPRLLGLSAHGRGAGRPGACEDQRKLRGAGGPVADKVGGSPRAQSPQMPLQGPRARAQELPPGKAVLSRNFRTHAVAVTFLTSCTRLGPKAVWRVGGTRVGPTPHATLRVLHAPRDPCFSEARAPGRAVWNQSPLRRAVAQTTTSGRRAGGPRPCPSGPSLALRWSWPRPSLGDLGPHLPAPDGPLALVAPDPSPHGSLQGPQHSQWGSR